MTEIDRTTAREAMTYFGFWLGFRQSYLRVPGIQAAFLLGDEVLREVARVVNAPRAHVVRDCFRDVAD